MSDYTPGPWTMDIDVKTAIQSGTKHIAMVNYYNSPSDSLRVAGTEHDANARLITSAPELLEALKTAKETIRVWHGPNAWDIYNRSSPEMMEINAAIAKAEGK